MNEAVSPGALSTLFTDARTHNGWREPPVSDETLREIYAQMKWGPTSANCSPGTDRVYPHCRRKRTSAPGAFQRQSAKNPDRARHRYRRLGQ